MTQFRFIPMLCTVVMVSFLTSCGGSGSEKKADADTAMTATDTTKVMAPATPVSTITTTPENMVIIIQKVANYAKWKVLYDGHDTARLAAGLHNYVVGRGAPDSNMVLVALKADDVNKAKAFGKSPGLKAAMKTGGVMGNPTIYMGTVTWQDTAKLAPGTMRTLTRFAVKDWDAWVKGFEDGRQERMDNGLMDRIISHDVDNDKMGQIVLAVSDTAKAMAYLKSDALKKRRAASGVVGTPAPPFVFTIAQRY